MSEMSFFTIKELCYSDYAARNDIPNEPDDAVFVNLNFLIYQILDPIRRHLRTPIVVTSGYRSPALNRWVGGSEYSQHMTGSAADIRAVGYTAGELFEEIKQFTPNNLEYLDQCILEFDSWVHVSVERFEPRCEFLIARKVNGRTTYTTGGKV